MPTPVFLALTVLIGTYVILAGAASVGVVLSQRQVPPPAPSTWPTVSVLVPAVDDTDPTPLQQIQGCDYPTDRLELLIPTVNPTEDSPPASEGAATVSRVPIPEGHEETPHTAAPLKPVLDAAEGDVVLSMPAAGTPSSGWVRSMVRHCTTEAPIVVGPTIVEHEDLFLPRLQALSHLGRLAWTAGASHFGLPAPVEASNRAVRSEMIADDRPSSYDRTLTRHATLNLDPDALVARSPVDSFEAFLRHLAQGFRRAVQSGQGFVQGQGLGLWGIHTVLLVCALIAVAVPAWRRPTLLALAAKMGADVLLTLPTATHYDQRPLFRSLVPTELMLLLALPISGAWALVLPTGISYSDAPLEDMTRES